METLLNSLGLNIGSIIGVAVLINAFEEVIDRFWNLDGNAAQIRTWFWGLAFAVLGFYLDAGIFSKDFITEALSGSFNILTKIPAIVIALFFGFLSALLSNLGFNKIKYVKILLEILRLRVPIDERK